MNLKIVLKLLPLTGQNIESYVDILNLLNTRPVTAVTVEDGPNFGTPKTLATAMLLRLGARYKF
jgi:hypothetical protein